MLDLRLPIGLLFSLLGILIGGYGFLADPSIYKASLGININAWAGLIMLAFGLVMLGLTRRGKAGDAGRV